MKRGENTIKRLLKIAPAAVFVMTLLAPASLVAAQSAGQGLEISPPLVEINTDPGKTVNITINVRNVTKAELIAKPQVNDFVAQGEEGQPKLLLNSSSSEPDPYSINGWVGGLSDLDLSSQEVKSESFTVNVPAKASPGGHYGVVRFTSQAPGVSGTGVALSASVGTLVLINVSGNVVQKANIASFYTTQNGKQSGFFQAGPVGFTLRLQNQGNSHFKPTGTIRVTNTFGKETGVISINSNGGNVLPASIRRFDQTLNKKRLFGRYTAVANVQYSGKTLTKSITFWVIPYKQVAIVLGALIVAFALIRIWVKRSAQKIARKSHSKK